MKLNIIISSFALLSLSFAGRAQTQELTINGLKVIFKPSTKQSISAIMFYKGGLANYTKDQQGIEELTLGALSECGTQKYSKDAFKDMEDKYGISIGGQTGYDFGYLSLSCVKSYFHEGWDLFTQAITAPVFDPKELSILQQKYITGLKNQESDPDTKLDQMAMTNAFSNTRYENRPGGTLQTMEQFKRDEVNHYYQETLLNKNRMLLVVVGNVELDDLKKLVETTLNNLPAKPLAELPKPVETQIEDNTVNMEQRGLATNYITGIMGAPSSKDKDLNAYKLSFSILSDKLFEEVRTKRNLSYAPYSYAVGSSIPYSAIYVTTTKPKEAATVMVNEIKRLRNNGFTPTDLKDAKAQYLTSYFMKNESTYSVAYALGRAELNNGWKTEETFLKDIEAIKLEEMQKVFNKYAKGIKWNYLGNEKDLDKGSFELKPNAKG